MKKFEIILVTILCFGNLFSQEKGVVNNVDSKFVKFKSIDIGDCVWTDGFWADKFEIAEKSMVPSMGKLLASDTGHALNNFKIAAGLKEGKHQGMFWHDGDFYKWMEAALYIYAINKDSKIVKEIDEYIEIIGKAQLENGYLQTQVSIPGKKPFSERKHHEMYNAGHLYISAIIHHRITGKRNFLDIAIKHANNLYSVFQPQPKELARFGFNQVQIMGLVELYRTTKDKKYLELAEIFVNMRGKSKVTLDDSVRFRNIGDMTQERTALRDEDEAVGHAVLALYYYAGASDIYAETGEQALIDALDRIWGNIVDKKMFITGACGQKHDGGSSQRDFVHEAFTVDYEMHNAHSYNETCANLCNAMFNYRMLSVKGEAKYADVIETVMYNSALSGIDIGGTNFFYTNPLRRGFDHKMGATDYATRVAYIPCFCCPPNLVRTIAKLSAWAYSLTKNGIAVNLYGGNKLETNLLDKSKIKVVQKTVYPWDGTVSIEVLESKKEAFDIMLRIPEWAKGSTVSVNGKEEKATAGTYFTMNRKWKKGDIVSLYMPMKPELVVGHRNIEEVRNQAAIKRGPVVYCIETPDLPKNTNILDVYIPSGIKLTPQKEVNFLGGLSTLKGTIMLTEDRGDKMYKTLEKPTWKTFDATFIPYYAWSNRGVSEMTVFMPIIWE
ncbi:glycoside hydrolase family 127 protein [Tamlana sp. 2_MG-2023]|uniref:glycoside hydrolase family 127 protein n=1 Tax=unclassified Tamlana TaxID=2614803 RepID=UPI0026E31396|nr:MULTISPECIES: beta-L-arabinofuranosidase domain-containing protein [unclassified Tamlana]MDO6760971.1 glycoside hydrolase family 127 protein [Tamlana sp. 2_MG-2023]MDO6791227.1 glycoside hydrolase family 127 protein [Tamlana sp. 1_MG-2023]